ncbi:hypothetical protein [Microseira wollei]|uniref:Uncharacterized protein n=1 Tax=Microseira wollei NIES-4236 TaxID=2530354 RepID=A0AAV3X9R9_9CYAN|nr:hypothetical protein [Microseira wollei]GET36087.1 hypothetical protein MiSe_08350 [Microseira wollei NIES-4236]
MSIPKEFVLIKNILLTIPCYDKDVSVVLEAIVKLDLSEFQLTQEEADKPSQIMYKLTGSLSEALSKDCLATYISTALRPKDNINQLSAP